jgi:hypothetical protein
MDSQKVSKCQSQESTIITKVYFFEQLVESSVNQQYISKYKNEMMTGEIPPLTNLKEFKIRNKDLIDPNDGTKLAAFVDGIDDSESENEHQELEKIINISWSWPPLRQEKDDNTDLLSSFEIITLD